ncbi:2OG-Fe(II) oxygenase [Marinobacter salinisoli]|uniref:2OG-Fe(II) oxygenase n=1 Tax=Marinobacter salinisoli TaxID=2769486 RepID=A0ABX7MN78_9GAMM|nr:2OG-Fe(II) oxygenase [Marinobacter salinisoli]QSP93702.1 2OG-Fe(II) oxygenase [Marinobacter salinisoli]
MAGEIVTAIDAGLDKAEACVIEQAIGARFAGLDAVSDPEPQVDCWLDSLADALAEHGWTTLDVSDRLGRPLLHALASEVEALERADALKKAGVGRGADHVQDRSIRRDKIAWLQGITEPQKALFEHFDAIRAGLNRRLFLGLKRFETHYATFRSGDFYRRHLDSFQGRSSRVVSLVLYLNDNWRPEDGGELRIFNRESEREVCGLVLPEMGRVAVFLSEEVPHEVLPANRTRYSLACWFRQDEVPLPL